MSKKSGRVANTKKVLVTVGTTSFDNLIKSVDTEIVREVLLKQGYDQLILQIGNGNYIPMATSANRLQVDYYRLKDDIKEDIYSADLVISHAGAGTVLETLGAKKPLVVVINEELMGNHQIELAQKLSKEGHLISCTCGSLADTLCHMDLSVLKPFPGRNLSEFVNFLNKIMNF